MQERYSNSSRLARPAPRPPGVLIVDDNRDFAENIGEVVEEFGLGPDIAHTGAEALELFVQRSFSAAIVDIQLPDMTGTKVIARIKELDPDCACIVFTGNATLSNAIDALNRGAFAYLVKGGEVNEFRAVLSNALAMRQTGQDLKQIRGINQAIMENFPGLMVILDADGRVVLSNNFQLPGIAGAETAANRVAQQIEDVFPPGQPWADEILERFQRSRSVTVPSILPRLSLATPEGGVRYFDVRFVPLFHALARCLIIVEETTQTVTLQNQMEKAAKLAAMGELTAMIAHEVRNPLSGISGAIQILRRKLPPGSPDREICDQVISQVDRLNDTIEDLLVLERPMRPKLAAASMNDLLESAIAFLRDDSRFKNVEIHYEMSGEDARCSMDPFLFRQAFVNVMINASQAMGGQGSIHVQLSSDANRVVVKVLDKGPGFSESPTRLFEPFFTTKPAGTGLGLPITSKILDVHGGQVGIRNHEKGGAEVTLEIPRGRTDR